MTLRVGGGEQQARTCLGLWVALWARQEAEQASETSGHSAQGKGELGLFTLQIRKTLLSPPSDPDCWGPGVLGSNVPPRSTGGGSSRQVMPVLWLLCPALLSLGGSGEGLIISSQKCVEIKRGK